MEGHQEQRLKMNGTEMGRCEQTSFSNSQVYTGPRWALTSNTERAAGDFAKTFERFLKDQHATPSHI